MSSNELAKVQTLVITVTLAPASVDKFRDLFKAVHYHPDGQVSKHVQKEAEVWFGNWQGFPESVEQLEDIPNVKILQLSSGTSPHCSIGMLRADTLWVAGANAALKNKVLQDERAGKQIALCSASGMSVPFWTSSCSSADKGHREGISQKQN